MTLDDAVECVVGRARLAWPSPLRHPVLKLTIEAGEKPGL